MDTAEAGYLPVTERRRYRPWVFIATAGVPSPRGTISATPEARSASSRSSPPGLPRLAPDGSLTDALDGVSYHLLPPRGLSPVGR
jgi:hypothetical protein